MSPELRLLNWVNKLRRNHEKVSCKANHPSEINRIHSPEILAAYQQSAEKLNLHFWKKAVGLSLKFQLELIAGDTIGQCAG